MGKGGPELVPIGAIFHDIPTQLLRSNLVQCQHHHRRWERAVLHG